MSQTNRRQTTPARKGEIGQTIIIVAFAAIALFAMIGLAIDAGRLYVTRAELSRSVDAAALSGILEFNGTTAGLSNGEDKAEDYFYENEGADDTTLSIVSDGNENQMTVDATKTVDLIFMRVLGIDTATVSAHAKAGFGTQYMDTVMVLDATPSMAGDPLVNAKAAAISFKDILLGSNPQGNALVGVTPFRGCFDPPKSTTADCIDTAQISGLSSNNSSLNSIINGISASGGFGTSATNVCTGLAKGWDILAGTVSGQPNHDDDILYPGNQQVMVLLSDGDNAYWGSQSYQDPYYTGTGAYNTSSSPTGTTVGGTVFPCQPIDATGGSNGSPCPAPWNSPSISSTYPCYKGVYTPATTIAGDNWDGPGWNGCPSSWSSGSAAWSSGSWTVSSPAPEWRQDGSPLDTGCHVRLDSNNWMCRSIDLTTYPGGTLYFSTKDANTWESSDDAFVQVNTSSCTAGSGWSNLWTRTGSNIPSSYNEYNVSLDSYAGQVVYIRFQASMSSTSDFWYIDNVWVEAGSSGSSNGYLNGNDNSSPQNCDSEQKPRERQMDVRTLALANAIKAQGVELYVVAFAGGVPNCYLGQDVIYDDENPSDCGLITDDSSYPIGASGPDGYYNQPNTPNPNVRLLQCIASSSAGTTDHYFYAEDDDELVGIFTTIATQIAHRLIE